MSILDARPAADGTRLRPVLAAATHLVALGTTAGTFAGIGRWRPDVYEHDRFGTALAAGLLAGAVLTLLSVAAVARPLRRDYLTCVGVGLLPSFAAAGLLGLLATLPLADGAATATTIGLVVGALVGGLAGSDLVLKKLDRTSRAVILGVLAPVAAMILWTAAALYQ